MTAEAWLLTIFLNLPGWLYWKLFKRVLEHADFCCSCIFQFNINTLKILIPSYIKRALLGSTSKNWPESHCYVLRVLASERQQVWTVSAGLSTHQVCFFLFFNPQDCGWVDTFWLMGKKQFAKLLKMVEWKSWSELLTLCLQYMWKYPYNTL